MAAELKSITMLMLSLGFLIVFANTAPAEEHEIHRDTQIREAKAAIQELEAALEQNPDSERAGNWKANLQEYRALLKRLTSESGEMDKPQYQFPEIEIGIAQTKEQLTELRQAVRAAKAKDGNAEQVAEYQQAIAQQEERLEELTGMLEERRAQRKKAESREHQIRQTRAAIQELKAALEQDPDSERADNWRASLQEHRKKLERLMGETRRTDRDRRRGPAGQLLVGWVISGTEEDVTVRTLETGKVMVLRIPRPRQHDGAWVGRTDLAQLARRTTNLEKEQLILARYHGGEGSEAYWLRQVKVISLTEAESDEKPDLLRRVQSLEHRLARIEDMLERRLRERGRSEEKPGAHGSEQRHRAEDEAQERETHSEDGRR